MSKSKKGIEEMKENLKKAEGDQKDEDITSVENESIESTEQAVCESCEELKDKLLRLHADMDNLRKRTQRDVENAYKFSLEKFVKSLLPVLDTFDLAIKNTKSQESLEGIQNIQTMFLTTLKKENIEVINPQGGLFDPALHEAVTTLESADHTKDQIVDVLQKGYQLSGRLIRPAMVCIAK